MPGRKRVEWDEKNLERNAEYQRLHPVTMHITEPKTPYVYLDDDVDPDEEAAQQQVRDKWDPKVNAYVHELHERVLEDRSSAPVAPISSSGRPMLATGTVTGELERAQRHEQFRKMRKAVYADEGAKFKALLAKKDEDDDDDDDEDEDEDEEKKGHK